MKPMDRRLSRIREQLAQRNGRSGVGKQRVADILRDRYRRRMEANGETYVESPAVRLTHNDGRPLTIADVLRAGRYSRSLQADHEAGAK